MYPAAKFWNRMAKGYAKSKISDEASYQKKLEVTQGYLKPDMEVLEFGCGTGSTAIVQAPFVKRLVGLDISEKMLALAQAKTEAAGLENLTFECSSLEDYECAEGSWDVVMGHSILHLLDDKEATIAHVYALLKPGGIFVSSTVCIGEMNILFRTFAKVLGLLRLIPVLKTFDKAELIASITNAGFVIDYNWQPKKGAAVFLIAQKPVRT